MKKEWVVPKRYRGAGEDLYIGKVLVGSWYCPLGAKGEVTKYRAQLNLPGLHMRDDSVDFPDAEQAKARLERAVDTWFKWLEETRP